MTGPAIVGLAMIPLTLVFALYYWRRDSTLTQGWREASPGTLLLAGVYTTVAVAAAWLAFTFLALVALVAISLLGDLASAILDYRT